MQTIHFSVQTSGIRIRFTGYSFRKALETEKNMLESFLHQGKNATYVIFVQNHLKREKTQKKKIIFPFGPPGFGTGSGSARRFLPGSGSPKKKCGCETLKFSYSFALGHS